MVNLASLHAPPLLPIAYCPSSCQIRTPPTARGASVLAIEGLVCRYGKVEAVRELTMEAREGELVTLIGANGAGKTSALSTISSSVTEAVRPSTVLGRDMSRAGLPRV